MTVNQIYNSLTGQGQEHLVKDESINRFFHKEVYQDFIQLKEEAGQDGIDIYVVSSFRSFSDQLNIWNAKAKGERKLLSDNGEELRFIDLSPTEVMFAILRWSALPGASRHHWGTDFDLVDKNSWPKNYEVQLIPQEFEEAGHFHKFTNWMNEKINSNTCKFFRPYSEDKNGVAPELWHFSHKEVSEKLSQQYTLELFLEHIEQLQNKDFLLHDEVKMHAEEIYHRFFLI